MLPIPAGSLWTNEVQQHANTGTSLKRMYPIYGYFHIDILAHPEALGPDRGQPDRAAVYHPYACMSLHRFLIDITSKYILYQPLACRVRRVHPHPPPHKVQAQESLVEAVRAIANPSLSMLPGLAILRLSIKVH